MMSYIENIVRENLIEKETKKNEVPDVQDGDNHLPQKGELIVKEVECKNDVKESTSLHFGSFKDKPPLINFTLEDLEQKSLELINLQRTIVDLRHSKQKKIKSNAKQLKLSINSNFYLGNPDINMNFEMLKKIDHENELVRSEIDYLYNSNQKKFEIVHCNEHKISGLFRNANEYFYKMFVGRVGHMNGENQTVFVVLSSEVLYIVDRELHRKLSVIPYEKIEFIIVGESDRWISIVSRSIGLENGDLLEGPCGSSRFQIDLAGSRTTNSLIKHLEIAVRRRHILRLSAMSHKHDQRLRRWSRLPVARSLASSAGRFLSLGNRLAPLLPGVVSAAEQEVEYIQNWLMAQLKADRRPRVLACWLVFWESGNERSEPEFGPRCDGFLMVRSGGGGGGAAAAADWEPAYFVLKGGMLYQFGDACDVLPQSVTRVADCRGCRRLPAASARPHAFELLRRDGTALSLAAPNESTASEWLQAFLRLICVGQDVSSGEPPRLRSCQVVQTTEALFLAQQSDVVALLKCHSQQRGREGRERARRRGRVEGVLSTPRRSARVIPPLLAPHSRGLDVRRPASRDRAGVDCRTLSREGLFSTSVPSLSLSTAGRRDGGKKNEEEEEEECSPTPPLPQIADKKPFRLLHNEITESLQNQCDSIDSLHEAESSIDSLYYEGAPTGGGRPPGTPSQQPSLQLLGTCNLDQISEVFVSAWPGTGCLMELECSEAGDATGDWALYFSCEGQLSSFLASVLKCRERITQDTMGVTRVSNGRVSEMLLEGSAAAKAAWDAPTEEEEE